MGKADSLDYLPVSRQDLERRGWQELDFVLISGDAYIDHPSFGAALIARLLESRGYRTGIIPQPDWRNVEDFRRLGRPRLAFLITAGNLDSMVSNYSVSRHRRRRDDYSPGARPGLRPDRATIVYTVCAKQAYKNVPVILGGLEASLRRLSHYDYWSDSVRRSVLLDAKADLLVYGMGELAILEIAEMLAEGTPVGEITTVAGTVFRRSNLEALDSYTPLPGFEEVRTDNRAFAVSFRLQSENCDPITAKICVEPSGDGYLVQNPPGRPLSQSEMDALYELPYTRDVHPMYLSDGGVKAIEEVRFSLVSSRGCFGGCSFCSLGFHQGRIVQARSHASLLREAEGLTRLPGFKGYIHDVGGPTANFRMPACNDQLQRGSCRNRQCLFPAPCRNLEVSHQDYLVLLRRLRQVRRVKKVFVRSGVRFDYLLADPDQSFFRELCEHHISGQLKVAPEHVSTRVLDLMGKPGIEVFERFKKRYEEINRGLGKRQYLVPYFISSHPGADLRAAVELAEYLRDTGFIPEQVQDFYPTPGTLSTCMYWTGLDPRTMKAVYVARSQQEKAMQRALIQFRDPRNRRLVSRALVMAGRSDLIGYTSRCLIKSTPNR
ncbi:MAG: YgiQ family radical SAM protein [Spirochaetia bacterium]